MILETLTVGSPQFLTPGSSYTISVNLSGQFNDSDKILIDWQDGNVECFDLPFHLMVSMEAFHVYETSGTFKPVVHLKRFVQDVDCLF